MLRLTLDSRRDTKELFRVAPCNNIYYTLLAFGEGAGFIKEDNVDVAGGLESQPLSNEQTVSCGEGGGDGGNERDGQAEGMRASDNEHGNDALQNKPGGLSGRGPGDPGEEGRTERHKGEVKRGFVGQDLGFGLAALSFGHELHNAGEGGV